MNCGFGCIATCWTFNTGATRSCGEMFGCELSDVIGLILYLSPICEVRGDRFKILVT